MNDFKYKAVLFLLLSFLLSLWCFANSLDSSLTNVSYTWGWVDQIVVTTFRLTKTSRRLRNRTSENCKLNVVTLRNQKLALTCGKGRQFISVLKSVCFTQLGNQLTAYATLFYFKRKFGFNAFITPYQAKSINAVMELEQMDIKPLHFVTPSCQNPRCSEGCQLPKWQSVYRHHHGENYQDLMKNSEKYMHNKLLDLGNHTIPIYLFREIMPELKRELKFQDYFIWEAEKIFLSQRKVNTKDIIFVGVHARRGDHLSSWMDKFPDSEIGKFEEKYFNFAMDMFRNKYNKNNTKVIFVATSDDFDWIKRNFLNPGDIVFTKELVKVKSHLYAGVDLATLSLCNHSIIDYGTFGMWGALLSGGKIVVPGGYSDRRTPDMRWWGYSGMDNVEVLDIRNIL